MASRGYGDTYIRYHLTQMGLPEDMAEHALKSLPEEWKEEMRIPRIVEKQKGKKRDLVKFLANRGFSYDTIYRALGGDER
jgi:SOS response regulatory protein OraA/RecX